VVLANTLSRASPGPGGPFAYDGRGNLTASGAKSFAYDAWNRLTAINGTPVTLSGRQILGAVLAAPAIFERLLGALLIAIAISGFTGLLTRDER
jgi:hypothetical protein